MNPCRRTVLVVRSGGRHHREDTTMLTAALAGFTLGLTTVLGVTAISVHRHLDPCHRHMLTARVTPRYTERQQP